MKIRVLQLVFTLLVLICFKTIVFAEFHYERSGTSINTGVVERSHWIVDFAFFDAFFDGSFDNTYKIAPINLRYGLTDYLELRLRSSALFFADEEVGFSNMALGYKWNLKKETKYLPAISFLNEFDLPVGSNNFTSETFQHIYYLLFEKSLATKWIFQSGIGLFWGEHYQRLNISSGDGSLTLPYFLTLNYQLSDKIILYSNIFGNWSFSKENFDTLALDLGFNYFLTEWIVLDNTIGMGLNSASPDLFVASGITFKF